MLIEGSGVGFKSNRERLSEATGKKFVNTDVKPKKSNYSLIRPNHNK